MLKKKIFLPLESIRGISALSIAIFHLSLNSHFDVSFFNNARFLVDFFFVLSGFLIAYNYSSMQTGKDLYDFQLKRFFRLYPLHLVMLFAFLGLETVIYLEETYLSQGTFKDAFTRNSWDAFLAHLFLLQSFITEGNTWNGSSWSISAEFYTYIIFGSLIIFTRNSPTLRPFCYMVIILLSGTILWTYGFQTNGSFRCFYSFFIGCMTYLIYEKSHKIYAPNRSFGALMLLTIITLCIIFIEYFESFSVLIPMLHAVLVLMFVSMNPQTWVYRCLEVKFLTHIGRLSFGIYMLHNFIWWILMRMLRFVFGFPLKTDENGNVAVFIESPYMGDMITIIGIIIVLILSHFSYNLFERPLNKYLRKTYVGS